MPELPNSLYSFFYPKSVAVIGASRNPQKLGAIILRNIQESGFTGPIYPVNPSCDEINKLVCFPDVGSLPSDTELVIISLPAMQVGAVLSQVGEKGVKNVIVLSAGFKETGVDGIKMEDELIQIAKQYDINLLGPNCLGYFNNLAPINATFGQRVSEAGNLRFVTQSGAIASSLFDWAQSVGLGISEFVTLGNKAVLNEAHILAYFHEQIQGTLHQHADAKLAKANPIGLYLEDITNGEAFIKIARTISKTDPIFIIKPGKTAQAAHAMQSHTGAIAGADDVLEEVLAESGIIRCDTLEDFFDLARAFSWEDVPQGPNVAVISNAGGPGVISADAVIQNGLELVVFEGETKDKLMEVLPRASSIINPVDVLGDALAQRYAQALEIVLQNQKVDSVVIILTPQIMTEIPQTAQIIGELSAKYNKPIMCSFMGGSLISEGETILNKFKIPSFRFPERAIAALGAMWKFKKFQMASPLVKVDPMVVHPEPDNIRQIMQEAINKNQKTLDNVTVDSILKSIKINTPTTKIVNTYNEALEFATQTGWPVVLKFSSPGLLHKKDVGGVEVNIMTPKQLDDAWHKLERKKEQLDPEIKNLVTFQIQQEVMGGIEVIIGVKYDPTFGAVLLFGSGGSYVDLISDKNLELLPIELPQAQRIVEGSKVFSLLKGKDGDSAYALDKLYELIVRVGKLATLLPEATEIEINPVIVTLNDVWAVDGKVVLRQIEKPKSPTPPKLMTAICAKHDNLASQFHYFEFETQQPLMIKPGQYLSVKVAPTAIRAYSIVMYEGPHKFGLLVDVRPGGPGSKFFEALKVGDKMDYLGPFGVFTINLEDEASTMVFLATGTGVGAVKCMIDSAIKMYGCTAPIHLYFGLTSYDEVFWLDYFKNLEQECKNFHFKLVLHDPDPRWNGPTGFITDEVRKDFSDASKCSVYLCGHRAMIADGVQLFLSNGCSKDRIYQERFI